MLDVYVILLRMTKRYKGTTSKAVDMHLADHYPCLWVLCDRRHFLDWNERPNWRDLSARQRGLRGAMVVELYLQAWGVVHGNDRVPGTTNVQAPIAVVVVPGAQPCTVAILAG